MIDNKVGKITKKEIMELCPDIRKYLHHSAQKSLCCGEYVYSTFFMPCYSCACLMGNSELLCMWSGWIVPLYREKSERRRESKRCDVYVLHSLITTTARQLAPCRGSDIRAVVGEV